MAVQQCHFVHLAFVTYILQKFSIFILPPWFKALMDLDKIEALVSFLYNFSPNNITLR